MHIKLIPIYGIQENLDFSVCKPTLILDNKNEERFALESGWTIYDNNWFQSRITRLDLSYYSNKPKEIKNHQVKYYQKFILNDNLLELYSEFLNKKQYTLRYDLNTDLDRSSILTVEKDGRIVAFTKFIRYNEDIESQFTVWDYKEPKLSIGRKIIDHEVEVAKNLGYKYLYIGSGYGSGGIYKSELKGFEWWDGIAWNTNKEEYVSLCYRDSKITTLQELNDAYNT